MADWHYTHTGSPADGATNQSINCLLCARWFGTPSAWAVHSVHNSHRELVAFAIVNPSTAVSTGAIPESNVSITRVSSSTTTASVSVE